MKSKTPFKVGDWADHKSGQLDPRRVTRVERGNLWLDILGRESGPFPATNYDNTRDAAVYSDEPDVTA